MLFSLEGYLLVNGIVFSIPLAKSSITYMSGSCRNFCCIENKGIPCSTRKSIVRYRTVLSRKTFHQPELMAIEQLKITGLSSICLLLHFRQHFHEMICQDCFTAPSLLSSACHQYMSNKTIYTVFESAISAGCGQSTLQPTRQKGWGVNSLTLLGYQEESRFLGSQCSNSLKCSLVIFTEAALKVVSHLQVSDMSLP